MLVGGVGLVGAVGVAGAVGVVEAGGVVEAAPVGAVEPPHATNSPAALASAVTAKLPQTLPAMTNLLVKSAVKRGHCRLVDACDELSAYGDFTSGTGSTGVPFAFLSTRSASPAGTQMISSFAGPDFGTR